MNLRRSVGIFACPLTLILSLTFLLAGAPLASAQVNVTTQRYDQSRTGANLNETQLNTTNVNVNQFGKLWSYTVSGSVQAQPLYVQGVSIGGQLHNVLYVVTMNDMVYAFDADSNSNTPLWSLNLTSPPNVIPVPIQTIVGANNLNIVGNVGIESTPYIDTSTNTMYFVARTEETAGGCGTVNPTFCQRLHAVDITTGAEKFGGPAILEGSVPGNNNESVNGTLTFDPLIHNQRSSLAMANGQIFFAWASHEDDFGWHGWVMAYNASNLKQQTAIWSASPDGEEAGMWMSGWAPAVDASGNVYYITGNGDWNGTENFGESMVKLGTTSGISVLDWFTPDSWETLNAGDVDFGSSGAILIPGTDLIVGAGKAAIFYLTHTTGTGMGHEQTGNGQIVQVLPNNSDEVKGGPVYWNRSGGVGPWMYVWANNDVLKAYHFNGTTFDTTLAAEGSITAASGESGGVLAISANASTAGSGIIWSSMPLNADGDHGVVQGVLRAENADNLQELWNSNMNATRDNSGNWPKYSVPTVVNGRVYMASFPADGVSNTAINVYGLLSTTPGFSISVSPTSPSVVAGGNVQYNVSTTAMANFSGTVNLSVTGLPAGTTASWSSSSVTAGGSVVLTVTTSTATPVGSYTLTITGTSGALMSSATATLGVTSSTSTSQGPSISINFVGTDTPMGASEIAGVVPAANWNQASGITGTLALVDQNGNPTGATVTWSVGSLWALPITDAPGNVRMMKGYLDPVGITATATVTGLPASPSGYDVYVYADGDNGSAQRTGNYQISGTGVTTTSTNITDAANVNFSGTFTLANNSAGNYAKFTISATGFTITTTPGAASDGISRAPLNGIQIVPHSASPNFSVSASPASGSVNAGQTSTFTVLVNPLNGFNQAVDLSCSGVPANTTCTVSPSSVTPNGTASVTATVTVTTTASSSLWPMQWRMPSGFELQIAEWLLALGILVSLVAWRKQRTRLAVCAATLVVIVAVAVGCGGGSSPASTGSTGTQSGTYTITVTGTSGSLTQSATYNLTVN